MKYILTILLICNVFIIYAQGAKLDRTIHVKRTADRIAVDGILDEDIWKHTSPAKDFIQYFPLDTVFSEATTEIHLAYDEANLYVGIKCIAAGEDWNVHSLRRDYRASGMDNITIIFDSFQDKTNAFFFGINPEGVVREGVIANGGNDFRDFDESWDNKWRGEAKKFGNYYTAELEIPFRILRFNEGSKKWNFGAYRFDTQHNEWSTWTGIPNNYPMMNLAFTGDMIWEEPLEATTGNIALIPYVSSGYSKDYEEGSPSDFKGDLGGDVKIGISSGLNLDLTINPDFSQVEVDRQITDLSRFEIFFPERRQFFLENADLFGNFGFSGINPFFSRRIGVASNRDGVTVQNRIFAGARLSGKLNDELRIGLLNMQTGSDKADGVYATNYTVAAVQQKVLKRSNLSFLFVNKQVDADEAELGDKYRYDRIAGMDFNFASESNTWYGKTFFHTSFNPGISGLALAHGTELNYSSKRFQVTWSHEYVSDDYTAEVGFIRRRDYFKIQPEWRFTQYPNNDLVNEYSLGMGADVLWMPGFGKTDHTYSIGIGGTMADNSRFRFSLNHDYVYLFNAFDPTGTDSEKLPEETSYSYINFTGFYFGDQSKKVSYTFRPYIGKYFNGWRYGTGGSVRLNYRPKGSIAVDINYNRFHMPHLDEAKQTFLIGPRIDYTFSRKVFLTTFIQYNTQAKNTNINARFQWRFAPVSDFFLVYTDNYLTGNVNDPSDRFAFDIKNRSIVAKLTYWLNL